MEVVLELLDEGVLLTSALFITWRATACSRAGIFFEVVTRHGVCGRLHHRHQDGRRPLSVYPAGSARRDRQGARRRQPKPPKAKEAAAANAGEFTLAIGRDSRRASSLGVPYSLSRPSALQVETRLGATPSQFFGVVHFVLSFNSDFVRIPRMAYGAPCGVCA